MELLNASFYKQLEEGIYPNIENKDILETLRNVVWKKEARRCLDDIRKYVGRLDPRKLKKNDITQIGTIDFCWNEYASDIEIDFLSENTLETAFDGGSNMNDSIIDNDIFFAQYFEITGDAAWNEIGDDYLHIITIYEYLLATLTPFFITYFQESPLPLKTPCVISFAGHHDEERVLIGEIH